MTQGTLESIGLCMFKRTETSPWEPGLVFFSGTNQAVDRNGEVVPGPVWDVKDLDHLKIDLAPFMVLIEETCRRENHVRKD
jgi:hypothetical protein